MEGRLGRHLDQLKENLSGEERKSSTLSAFIAVMELLSEALDPLVQLCGTLISSQATLALFTCTTLAVVQLKPPLNTFMAHSIRLR